MSFKEKQLDLRSTLNLIEMQKKISDPHARRNILGEKKKLGFGFTGRRMQRASGCSHP